MTAVNLQDIKGIVFDKDGTLLDFHSTWVPRMHAILMQLCNDDVDFALGLAVAVGYDVQQQRVRSGSILAAGNNLEIAQAWAQPLGRSVNELEAILNREFASDAAGGSVAVEDLTASMQRLRDLGYLLGVATMDSEAGIEATLAPFDCLDLFSFKAGYDSGHGSKPGPGMVHGFCEAMGLPPKAVMVVGDNTHDLHMGLSAGAGVVVGVLTGTSVASELYEAHYVLDSVADLPDLLSP